MAGPPQPIWFIAVSTLFFALSSAAPYLDEAAQVKEQPTMMQQLLSPITGLIGPLLGHGNYTESTSSGPVCYHMMVAYQEGEQIISSEPCLNCTCRNGMLMCYLKVCPFSKPIGKSCKIEKKPGDCCPTVTCLLVPVIPQLMQMGPAYIPRAPENDTTAIEPITFDKGCSIDSKYYEDGAMIDTNSLDPCNVCYCIRNEELCTRQECTLAINECQPVYASGVCCPIKYECEMAMETTTQSITTTIMSLITDAPSTKSNCMHNNTMIEDGTIVKSEDACQHCYCMKGEVICIVNRCGKPEIPNLNCKPKLSSPSICCPVSYDCSDIIESNENVTVIEALDVTPQSPRTTTEHIYSTVTIKDHSDTKKADAVTSITILPDILLKSIGEASTTGEPVISTDTTLSIQVLGDKTTAFPITDTDEPKHTTEIISVEKLLPEDSETTLADSPRSSTFTVDSTTPHFEEISTIKDHLPTDDPQIIQTTIKEDVKKTTDDLIKDIESTTSDKMPITDISKDIEISETTEKTTEVEMFVETDAPLIHHIVTTTPLTRTTKFTDKLTTTKSLVIGDVTDTTEEPFPIDVIRGIPEETDEKIIDTDEHISTTQKLLLTEITESTFTPNKTVEVSATTAVQTPEIETTDSISTTTSRLHIVDIESIETALPPRHSIMEDISTTEKTEVISTSDRVTLFVTRDKAETSDIMTDAPEISTEILAIPTQYVDVEKQTETPDFVGTLEKITTTPHADKQTKSPEIISVETTSFIPQLFKTTKFHVDFTDDDISSSTISLLATTPHKETKTVTSETLGTTDAVVTTPKLELRTDATKIVTDDPDIVTDGIEIITDTPETVVDIKTESPEIVTTTDTISTTPHTLTRFKIPESPIDSKISTTPHLDIQTETTNVTSITSDMIQRTKTPEIATDIRVTTTTYPDIQAETTGETVIITSDAPHTEKRTEIPENITDIEVSTKPHVDVQTETTEVTILTTSDAHVAKRTETVENITDIEYRTTPQIDIQTKPTEVTLITSSDVPHIEKISTEAPETLIILDQVRTTQQTIAETETPLVVTKFDNSTTKLFVDKHIDTTKSIISGIITTQKIDVQTNGQEIKTGIEVKEILEKADTTITTAHIDNITEGPPINLIDDTFDIIPHVTKLTEATEIVTTIGDIISTTPQVATHTEAPEIVTTVDDKLIKIPQIDNKTEIPEIATKIYDKTDTTMQTDFVTETAKDIIQIDTTTMTKTIERRTEAPTIYTTSDKIDTTLSPVGIQTTSLETVKIDDPISTTPYIDKQTERPEVIETTDSISTTEYIHILTTQPEYIDTFHINATTQHIDAKTVTPEFLDTNDTIITTPMFELRINATDIITDGHDLDTDGLEIITDAPETILDIKTDSPEIVTTVDSISTSPLTVLGTNVPERITDSKISTTPHLDVQTKTTEITVLTTSDAPYIVKLTETPEVATNITVMTTQYPDIQPETTDETVLITSDAPHVEKRTKLTDNITEIEVITKQYDDVQLETTEVRLLTTTDVPHAEIITKRLENITDIEYTTTPDIIIQTEPTKVTVVTTSAAPLVEKRTDAPSITTDSQVSTTPYRETQTVFLEETVFTTSDSPQVEKRFESKTNITEIVDTTPHVDAQTETPGVAGLVTSDAPYVLKRTKTPENITEIEVSTTPQVHVQTTTTEVTVTKSSEAPHIAKRTETPDIIIDIAGTTTPHVHLQTGPTEISILTTSDSPPEKRITEIPDITTHIESITPHVDVQTETTDVTIQTSSDSPHVEKRTETPENETESMLIMTQYPDMKTKTTETPVLMISDPPYVSNLTDIQEVTTHKVSTTADVDVKTETTGVTVLTSSESPHEEKVTETSEIITDIRVTTTPYPDIKTETTEHTVIITSDAPHIAHRTKIPDNTTDIVSTTPHVDIQAETTKVVTVLTTSDLPYVKKRTDAPEITTDSQVSTTHVDIQTVSPEETVFTTSDSPQIEKKIEIQENRTKFVVSTTPHVGVQTETTEMLVLTTSDVAYVEKRTETPENITDIEVSTTPLLDLITETTDLTVLTTSHAPHIEQRTQTTIIIGDTQVSTTPQVDTQTISPEETAPITSDAPHVATKTEVPDIQPETTEVPILTTSDAPQVDIQTKTTNVTIYITTEAPQLERKTSENITDIKVRTTPHVEIQTETTDETLFTTSDAPQAEMITEAPEHISYIGDSTTPHIDIQPETTEAILLTTSDASPVDIQPETTESTLLTTSDAAHIEKITKTPDNKTDTEYTTKRPVDLQTETPEETVVITSTEPHLEKRIDTHIIIDSQFSTTPHADIQTLSPKETVFTTSDTPQVEGIIEKQENITEIIVSSTPHVDFLTETTDVTIHTTSDTLHLAKRTETSDNITDIEFTTIPQIDSQTETTEVTVLTTSDVPLVEKRTKTPEIISDSQVSTTPQTSIRTETPEEIVPETSSIPLLSEKTKNKTDIVSTTSHTETQTVIPDFIVFTTTDSPVIEKRTETTISSTSHVEKQTESMEIRVATDIPHVVNKTKIIEIISDIESSTMTHTDIETTDHTTSDISHEVKQTDTPESIIDIKISTAPFVDIVTEIPELKVTTSSDIPQTTEFIKTKVGEKIGTTAFIGIQTEAPDVITTIETISSTPFVVRKTESPEILTTTHTPKFVELSTEKPSIMDKIVYNITTTELVQTPVSLDTTTEAVEYTTLSSKDDKIISITEGFPISEFSPQNDTENIKLDSTTTILPIIVTGVPHRIDTTETPIAVEFSTVPQHILSTDDNQIVDTTTVKDTLNKTAMPETTKEPSDKFTTTYVVTDMLTSIATGTPPHIHVRTGPPKITTFSPSSEEIIDATESALEKIDTTTPAKIELIELTKTTHLTEKPSIVESTKTVITSDTTETTTQVHITTLPSLIATNLTTITDEQISTTDKLVYTDDILETVDVYQTTEDIKTGLPDHIDPSTSLPKQITTPTIIDRIDTTLGKEDNDSIDMTEKVTQIVITDAIITSPKPADKIILPDITTESIPQVHVKTDSPKLKYTEVTDDVEHTTKYIPTDEVVLTIQEKSKDNETIPSTTTIPILKTETTSALKFEDTTLLDVDTETTTYIPLDLSTTPVPYKDIIRVDTTAIEEGDTTTTKSMLPITSTTTDAIDTLNITVLKDIETTISPKVIVTSEPQDIKVTTSVSEEETTVVKEVEHTTQELKHTTQEVEVTTLEFDHTTQESGLTTLGLEHVTQKIKTEKPTSFTTDSSYDPEEIIREQTTVSQKEPNKTTTSIPTVVFTEFSTITDSLIALDNTTQPVKLEVDQTTISATSPSSSETTTSMIKEDTTIIPVEEFTETTYDPIITLVDSTTLHSLVKSDESTIHVTSYPSTSTETTAVPLTNETTISPHVYLDHYLPPSTTQSPITDDVVRFETTPLYKDYEVEETTVYDFSLPLTTSQPIIETTKHDIITTEYTTTTVIEELKQLNDSDIPPKDPHRPIIFPTIPDRRKDTTTMQPITETTEYDISTKEYTPITVVDELKQSNDSYISPKDPHRPIIFPTLPDRRKETTMIQNITQPITETTEHGISSTTEYTPTTIVDDLKQVNDSYSPPQGTHRPIIFPSLPDRRKETTTTPTTAVSPIGPGACLFDGKLYMSAQQIPRNDPCDFCFCFRGDIICLQQSCPPPIHGCLTEKIPGFCCPRYECMMKKNMTLPVTKSPPVSSYPSNVKSSRIGGCEIDGRYYDVGEEITKPYTPCLLCKCGLAGNLTCDPVDCGLGYRARRYANYRHR